MTKPESPRALLRAKFWRSPFNLISLVGGITILCTTAVPRCVQADPPASASSTAQNTLPSHFLSDPGSKASALNRSGHYDRSALFGRGGTLARTALSYRGLPYRWGGTSPRSGFDCSGLVQTVCAKWGIYLPRCAGEQIHKGIPVKRDQLEAGDLVFFKNTYKRGLSHVGIYVGEGWFIHAAGRHRGVMLSRLDQGYHKKHWYGARRLDLSRLPAPPEEAHAIVKSVTVEDGGQVVTVPVTSGPALPSKPTSSSSTVPPSSGSEPSSSPSDGMSRP